jgi:ribosomal protein S18 acetylase RimI-like enzyme
VVTVERATPADTPALVELLCELFTQEQDFVPNAEKQQRGLELILASESVGQIFVAREGSAVVGMVSLLFTISTAEGGPVAWLEDMIVHPEARHRGVGSKLLDAAVRFAKDRGYLRITLLTDPTNTEAQGLYARRGFETSAMVAFRRKL